MSKHTPGPWVLHVAENGRGTISAITRCAGMDHIAEVYGANGEERGANARLIAAAPEMLETLTWIRDNCTGLPAVARALAEKAISKASVLNG